MTDHSSTLVATVHGLVDVKTTVDHTYVVPPPNCTEIDDDIRNKTNTYVYTQFARTLAKRDKRNLEIWIMAQVQTERLGWNEKLHASMKEIEKHRRMWLEVDFKVQDLNDKFESRLLKEDEGPYGDCLQDEENAQLAHLRMLDLYTDLLIERYDKLHSERESCLNLLNAAKHEHQSLEALLKQQSDDLLKYQVLAKKDQTIQRELVVMKDQIESFKKQHTDKQKRVDFQLDQIQKLKNLVEKLRFENADLKQELLVEQQEVLLDVGGEEDSLTNSSKRRPNSDSKRASGRTRLPPVMQRQNTTIKQIQLSRQVTMQATRPAAIQCIRCHKLYAPRDNHKMACHYHPKGKVKAERYDNTGRLDRVSFMWECCNQKPESGPCCHGEHLSV